MEHSAIYTNIGQTWIVRLKSPWKKNGLKVTYQRIVSIIVSVHLVWLVQPCGESLYGCFIINLDKDVGECVAYLFIVVIIYSVRQAHEFALSLPFKCVAYWKKLSQLRPYSRVPRPETTSLAPLFLALIMELGYRGHSCKAASVQTTD